MPHLMVVVLMIAVIVTMIMVAGALVIVSAIDRRSLAAHMELRCRHAGACDALGPDGVRIDGEASQGAAQVGEWQPRVEQRAQNHVAGCAREAVEIQDR